MSRNGKNNKGGRPKGSASNHTLLAQEAKKRIVERVTADVDRLYDAQKGLAIGSQVLMCKPKKGNTYIVEDLDLVMRYIDGEPINSEDEYFFMTLVKPENHAIDSLWDRALGKVPIGISGPDGKEPVQILVDFKKCDK